MKPARANLSRRQPARRAAPADWRQAAVRLARRLPVRAPRPALEPGDEPRLPLPADISIIARDRRLLPVEGRMTVNPDKYVLLVALAGRGLIELGGDRVRLVPGDTVMIFPHQAHQFGGLEPRRLHWVFLGFRLERAETLLRPLRNRVCPLPPALRGALVSFLAASLAGDPARVAYRHDLAAQFWLLLMALLRQARPAPAAAGAGSAVPQPRHWKLIESLCDYLDEHQDGLPSASIMARQAHVSLTSLRRQFRAAMGLSLGRYIRGRRLRQAVEFKIRSGATWSETAQRFGFGSVFSFSRAFKKEFKLSPTAYQRALKPG